MSQHLEGYTLACERPLIGKHVPTDTELLQVDEFVAVYLDGRGDEDFRSYEMLEADTDVLSYDCVEEAVEPPIPPEPEFPEAPPGTYIGCPEPFEAVLTAISEPETELEFVGTALWKDGTWWAFDPAQSASADFYACRDQEGNVGESVFLCVPPDATVQALQYGGWLLGGVIFGVLLAKAVRERWGK